MALALCIVSCLIGCASPRDADLRFEYSRRAMGVDARIVLHAPTDEVALAAARRAYAEIERLDRALSDWDPESELSRLSDRAGTGPVAVSRDLYDVLARAHEISAATDGAFDVTVGPLVALWRTARRTGTLPDADELAAARALVDWRSVALDEDARTVALARPGMRLDLGGIAKGYATQRAVEVLAEVGVTSALVQMGGDITCGVPPPGRDGWEIDVDGRRVLVHDTSVATSGDSEQHVDIGGVRYSHVVDPRTGLGLTTRALVTITAPDGTTADALSTAIGVLGDVDVEHLLRHFGAKSVQRRIVSEPTDGEDERSNVGR